MNILNNLEEVQVKKCQLHENCEIEYIQVNEFYDQKQDNLGLCYKCIPSLKIGGKNILFCQDLIRASNDEVYKQWPPLNNSNLMENLQNIYKNKAQENAYEKITQFFDELQDTLIQNIQIVKKQILSNVDQKFLKKKVIYEKYDQIAQTQKLQELIRDYYYNQKAGKQDLSNFINDFHRQKQDNEKKILDIINQCMDNQYFEFLVSNQLKDMIEILIELIGQSFGKQDEKVQSNLILLEQKMFKIISAFEKNNLKDQSQDLDEISKNSFESKRQIIKFLTIKNQIIQNQQSLEIKQDLNKTLLNYKQIRNQLSNLLKIKTNLISKNQFQQQKNIITNINENKSLQIITNLPYEFINIYNNFKLFPSAKYTIKVDYLPFSGYNEYQILLGVEGQRKEINSNYLNKNIYQFGNTDSNIQQIAQKGKKFYGTELSYNPIMRKLEFQFEISKKQFKLTDYPDNQNIIIAGELGYKLDDQTSFLLILSFKHIQNITIEQFTEEISLEDI